MLKNKLKFVIPIVLIFIIGIVSTAYAFFEYYRVGSNHQLIVGNISLKFNEGTDTINLSNVFPETIEEARAEGRKDNLLTFTISGVNTTTDENVYYEILLNNGDEEGDRTRVNPEHLVFDLIEIDENGNETYVVDAMSYDDFNEKRIWADMVKHDTTTQINRTYKLRMWLSEDVFISDTNPNADYSTDIFRNGFASVKVSVFGDFVEKYMVNYMVNLSSVTAITDQKANISEVNFISLTLDEINTRVAVSTINADVTDTSLGGNVKTWLETDTTDTTKYIMYVASEGTTYFPIDCNGMFNGFNSVTNFNFENIDTSKITNMSGMFYNCSSLKNIDINNWNTSNVTQMASMFGGCSSLIEIDLSNWNTSNVTQMATMFNNCSSLTELDFSNWDTSSLNIAASMFGGCLNLSSVNINNWDLTSLSSLSSMFYGCTELTSLSIDGWKLSNTFSFVSFISGSGVTSLELTNFDLSESTSMNGMFVGCSSLTSVSISGWDTSNITDAGTMFAACSSLTSVSISGFDTSNVTNMNAMFANCSNLTNLDLSNFVTTSVTNFGSMFYGCAGLSNLNISGFTFNNVTNSSSMFNGMSDTVNVIVGSSTQMIWILNLASPANRPSAWSPSNVVVG